VQVVEARIARHRGRGYALSTGGELHANRPLPTLLLIDDHTRAADAFRNAVTHDHDLGCVICDDPDCAVAAARELRPSVIVQGLSLPHGGSFRLLRSLRAEPELQRTPIVVLGDGSDERSMRRAFAAGATDYLDRLRSDRELVAWLHAHARMALVQRERDEAFDELKRVKEELERKNQELARLSALDALTGLHNRRHFDEALAREWRRALRSRSPLGLIMIDVDHFKRYNDRHGHLAGDACLRRIASCVAECVRRPGDLAARYGGEELVLLLPGTRLSGARDVAAALHDRVHRLATDPGIHKVTISQGVVSRVPSASNEPEELVARADTLLYAAKQAGRDRYLTRIVKRG
jgi:two-component system chemotaxis family response regulator WspR